MTATNASDERVSAAEAAAILGVKPETLYAYVSRGVLAPERDPGDRRSWFRRADLARLRARGHGPTAGELRRTGTVATGVTLIEDGHYWYRGEDPLPLAGEVPFEAVASLLWHDAWPERNALWRSDPRQLGRSARVAAMLGDGALPIDRIRVAVVAIGVLDDLRHDLRPHAIDLVGPRLITAAVDALGGGSSAGASAEDRVAHRLLACLSPMRATRGRVAAVDGALTLLADHGLTPSTTAVRIAAATNADPYAAVSAGLAVLGGEIHGGTTLAVEDLIDELVEADDVAQVVGARLRRGERLPGLGEPRYPAGDPRAARLFELVDQVDGDPAATRAVAALRHLVAERGLPAPNVDLALGTLACTLRMVRGGGEAILAIARIAGWLAHIGEEYASPSDLAARPAYSGRRPH